MQQQKLPPPWVMIFVGSVLTWLAYNHYCEISDFEAGVTDRVRMWSLLVLLYKTTGFWPTVTLPFLGAIAIVVAGITLQVRDIQARRRGESTKHQYEPLRWQGLLGALFIALVVIAGIFVLVFTMKTD